MMPRYAVKWSVATLITLMLSPLAGADTIRVRADAWFPVNGDPQAVQPGFGIEALRTIWKEAGHDLDYRLMSWGRSLEAVRNGSADCVIGAYKADAPDLRFPEQELGRDGVGIYVRAADEWHYSGIESLARRTVGVISEYSYGEELDVWLADSANATRIQMAYGADALEGNIRKLLAGRVDVLLESPMIMNTALHKLDLARFVRLSGEGKPPTPFYIACSADNPKVSEWLRQFDDGMVQLRQSGLWRALLEDYGLTGE
jgi:polar amino acid transport system substrate-binding protein